MYKPRKYVVFFVLAFFASAHIARAQTAGVVPDPVQYTVAPEVPSPNQQVTIVVQGVGTFLGGANIIWSENGKVVQSGTGLRNFTFTTGPLGTENNIHVEIDSQTAGTLTHDFTFRPSVVELVWEANTSAPPWYRGKPLYSGGSTLTVAAFPIIVLNGARVPASQLSFAWSHNGNPLPDQSGTGDNTFTFEGSQLQNSEDVSVDVSYQGTTLAHGDITIPATTPLLLLYDKDPLRGVLYDEALPDGISLTGNEITVQAAPYFFDNGSLASGGAAYTWTLDGDAATGPNSAQGILTLRQSGSGAGSANLGVSLQNNDSDKLVQAAQAALQIIFGQSSGSSVFGL